MKLVRSLVYVLWLYGSMAVVGIGLMPMALLDHRHMVTVARIWVRAALWGLRWIGGVSLEVRGREHIPTGPALVAAKHYAMFETLLPFVLLEKPSIVLKHELASTPVFGFYAAKGPHIVLDREAHAAALKAMLRTARQRIADGRQIFIFPEGTRQPVGAAPDYKPGVAALYRDLGVPCTPVALNTGLFWPRKGFVLTPGAAIIEFLPPIPPGLSRDAFMHDLETRIETGTAALLKESGWS